MKFMTLEEMEAASTVLSSSIKKIKKHKKNNGN